MKKIFKILFKVSSMGLIAIACGANLALAAVASHDQQNSKELVNNRCGFVLGINAVMNNMKFKQDFGSGLFAKHTIGVNPFIQIFPHKNFGLQVGVELYANASRKAYVNANSCLAGMKVLFLGNPPIGFFVLHTKIQQLNIPLNVIAKVIIKDNYFIELAPGVSISKLKASFTYLADQDDYLYGSNNFSKIKLVPICKMVFGYKFNNNFSIQALVGWRNTARFGAMLSNDAVFDEKAIINSKNSFNYGLGISYLFI